MRFPVFSVRPCAADHTRKLINMAITKPVGTKDMLPEEATFWMAFQETAADVFGRYGYQPIVTPVLEKHELFVRGIGEATDVVSKEMFQALSDENLNILASGGHVKSKSRLALRPEGTAGVVRAVAEYNLVAQGAAPVKLMYAGPMFRAERPQEGRQRQFNQIGIECLGADDPSVDAEGIIMLMRFYRELGIPSESIRLLVNSMGCEKCRPAYRDSVKAYIMEHADCMCEDCLRRAEINPLRAFDCKNEACRTVMESAPRISEALCDDCKSHYQAVKDYLDAAGLEYVEVYKLVRGLDYYTRTVFEVQTVDANNKQNAIGGGGRYDKLMQEIGGAATPGFGFALGYERCLLALKAAGYEMPKVSACDLFIACVNDEVRARAFALAQEARDAGVRCDFDHQSRSLKSQFKLADKLGSRLVAILGPDELAEGKVKIRDMANHEESMVDLDAIVEAVKGMLA